MLHAETGPELSLPPLKDLASSDPSLRRRSLQTLLTYLSAIPPSSHLTPLQALQIWTALFYTVYMHDPRSSSPLSTQTLITTLTTTLLHGTVHKSNPHLKVSLTAGFWEVMAREWNGIDRHRMDKYLLLIRSMLRAIFQLLYQAVGEDASEGEKEAARGHVDGLRRWPCSTGRASGGAEGRKVPDGIRYHVLDVWTDELDKVFLGGQAEVEGEALKGEGGGNGGEMRKKAVVDLTMELVERLARDALTKGVRLRAKEVLAEGHFTE